ncbi:hypothetical protein F383_12531 [Gossypium arboreum]|uniref:Uncharacterized protein n=1 Tax=Gossypium arboreum TaxID=29729 RepID=A0A0B0MGA1_GOSAR|nr:hypothetical protein F383_12531 [Gossypium arboreum]
MMGRLQSHGTHQATSCLQLTLLLVGIHCQLELLELMERNSFVKPGVNFPTNCSVHFWLTSRN